MSKLAAAIARNPVPRIKKERRAPALLTKNPALVLIATISNRPSQGCGAWSGASPRPTLTTNAAWRESIKPARQIAHVAAPAKKARAREKNRDFQANVFKICVVVERRCVPYVRPWQMRRSPMPTRLYTAGRRLAQRKRAKSGQFFPRKTRVSRRLIELRGQRPHSPLQVGFLPRPNGPQVE